MVVLVRDVGGISVATPAVVVGCYGNGGYEVEVVDDSGAATAVLTVAEADIRPAD